MVDAHQGAVVGAPFAALDADEAIIGPLAFFNHAMRVAEGTQKGRFILDHGTVREVAHGRVVGRPGVEVVDHVLCRQLGKRAGLPPRRPLPEIVQAGQIEWPDTVDEVVCEGAAVVRGGDGDERLDVDAGRLELGDHVPGVQAAHAMGDDVDALAMSLGLDVLGQLGGAGLDGATWGHRGGDDLGVIGSQGFLDAAPIADARQVGSGQLQLGESQQSMG